MKDFKLLTGEEVEVQWTTDDIFHYNKIGAGWVWASPDMYEHLRYEVVSEIYMGINHFIQDFPEGFIVMVRSITATQHNVVRDYQNQSDPNGNGWGFDIENDWLSIDWIRLLP
jgi:hypothetical protein